MTVRTLPESQRLCPRCGSPMTAIEIALPSPPYIVQLTGCEHCGITSNERPAASTNAAATMLRDYRRK